MASHVIVLDATRHQAFLQQQRIDPVTRQRLEPGDAVVVCAHCRRVFLEGSWEAIKGRGFGHGTDTLPDIVVDNEPLHFRSQRATPPPAPAHPNGETVAAATADRATPAREYSAATAALAAASTVAADVPRAKPIEIPVGGDRHAAATNEPLRTAGPLRLRDIPFRLREIPFRLREIGEF